MALQSVRGFKDVLPPQSKLVTRLESAARGVLALYGFQEIRLPTIETQELFVKTTGETTDIVEKEMFLLEDAGGRKLALRPEGTPGAVRAFLQHHLHQQGGRVKLFYVGSMFRAERPQAGRLREFTQIGAECFGNPHPAADVESILALARVMDEAGLKDRYAVHINSLGCESPDCRPAFRGKLLAHLETVRGQLCGHCQRRMERNPLRVLDCKGDAPRLRESSGLPVLAPCKTCEGHFEAVHSAIAAKPGLRVLKDPLLVRGLDYYTRTVFEFKSADVGAQDAIAAGGRYDGLVKSMGGPDTPAVGWAMGVERTLMAAHAGEQAAAWESPAVYVAAQSDSGAVHDRAIQFLDSLRSAQVAAEGGLFGNSLKAQMREAGRLGARWAVIFGDDEFKTGSCALKDMKNDSQQRVIPIQEAQSILLEALKKP